MFVLQEDLKLTSHLAVVAIWKSTSETRMQPNSMKTDADTEIAPKQNFSVYFSEYSCNLV